MDLSCINLESSEQNIKTCLNTGDIILCHGYNKGLDPGLDGLIEFATHSKWEHAGMIVRDPWWTSPPLKGLYIYQSSNGPNGYPDVLNGKKSGVTLNKLSDFLENRKHIYVRTLENFEWNEKQKALFVKLFKESHGKPYDKNICSWIGTGIGSFFYCKCISRKTTPETKKTFWCSALVSFFYVKMLWCNDCDWSCQTPEDLYNLKLLNPYSLSDIWLLK